MDSSFATINISQDKFTNRSKASKSMNPLPLPSASPKMAVKNVSQVVKTLWAITKDDTPTFIIPATIFGLSAALACNHRETSSSPPASSAVSATAIFVRLPLVLLFNFLNILVFDLSNQRSPASAAEDRLNKPWRPVPAGLLTCDRIRQLLLVAVPAVLLFNTLALDAGRETALLYTLTWLYNDLGGGDEDWFLRNAICACGFALYNLGSLRVALPAAVRDRVGAAEGWWIVLLALAILTTMHTTDLKDHEGDRLKGRRTLPVVIGLNATRLTLVLPVMVWTAVCAGYWGGGGWLGVVSACLALQLVRRLVKGGDKTFDRKTWQLWCLWTASLYVMPLASVR